MFTYKLELADGTAADPPTLQSATPTWSRGDVIYFGRERVRVIDKRRGDPPTLVIEPVPAPR